MPVNSITYTAVYITGSHNDTVNTNTIYRLWLTKCPGALTNVNMRSEIDEFFKKILKSIRVSGKLNTVR